MNQPLATGGNVSSHSRSGFFGAHQAWAWCALALLVRLAYLGEQGIESPLFRQPLLDELEAVNSARALLTGEGFGAAPLFKAPGYSLFLAAVMAVFGDAWPWGVRLIQHMLGAALAGLACDAARRLVPAGRPRFLAGALAGVSIALYGPLVRLESCVCLDLLVAFFQSAMVWALVRWTTRGSIGRPLGWLWTAGALAAASWLTRPTLTPVLPLLALWAAFDGCRPSRGRHGLRRAAGIASVFLALPLAAMAAVFARNAAAGEPMLMPWQGGYNLYHANRAGASGRYLTQTRFATSETGNPTQTLAVEGWRQARIQKLVPSAPPGRTYKAVDDYWFGLARREIAGDPARWLGLMGRKVIYLVSDKEIFNFEEYDLQRSLSRILPWLPGRFGLIWPFALASVALIPCIPPRRRGSWEVLWIYFLGLSLSIALYYASGRMRMPLVFPATVCAASGVALLFGRSTLTHRRLLTYGALAAVGAISSWGDWWGVRSERMHHVDLGRLSNAAWRDGRPELALGFAERAARERPEYPTLPLLQGQALYALGRKDEAAQAFRESLSRLPDDPVAPYNLGSILYYDLNRPAEALQAYAEALRREPAYHQAAWRSVLVRLKLGDAAGARNMLSPYAALLKSGAGGSAAPLLLRVAAAASACASGDRGEARRIAEPLSEAGKKELLEELDLLKLGDCL